MMREEGLYEVLLDLSKDYGALDQERCTEILVEYVFVRGWNVSSKDICMDSLW